jgi:predicted DNA-binding transcriptional regulator AlpA
MAAIEHEHDLLPECDVLPRARMSSRTLARMVKKGAFPAPVPHPGKQRLWSRAAVDQWCAALFGKSESVNGACTSGALAQ